MHGRQTNGRQTVYRNIPGFGPNSNSARNMPVKLPKFYQNTPGTNGRRKPEQLDQNTYSLTNYREFETIVADYDNLRVEAENLNKKIPAAYKDAYYELVLHPVQACSNLNDLYFAAAKNALYARQGRAATNDMANSVKTFYARDSAISNYYNDVLAGGKWHHMMDQTHIGYTNWQEPRVQKMPRVTEIQLPAAASMGVGSRRLRWLLAKWNRWA